MKELVIVKRIDKKDVAVTTSKIISDRTNKKHSSIQRLIKRNIISLEMFGRVGQSVVPLKTKGGIQNTDIYYLNEQQFTLLVTFMHNNKEVLELKIQLVKDFFRMREFIQQKQTIEWKDARENTKKFNRNLTDAIKELVEYAETQGSKSPNMYYIHYSKLINKCLSIESGNRNELMPNSMMTQTFASKFLEKEIYKGIQDNIHYKLIYNNCKDKVDYFMECFSLKLKA